jgi:hypothetical protein
MKPRMAARPVTILQQGKGASGMQAFIGSGFTIIGYINCEPRTSYMKLRKAEVSFSIKLAAPVASGRAEP